MRTRLLWAAGSTAAIAAAFVASQVILQDATAQVTYPNQPAQSTMDSHSDHDADHDADSKEHAKVCKASELIGMNVRGRNGDDAIGSINDLVIDDQDGRIKYAAVSFGGFLGMGDKLFAVPFEAIEVTKTDDDDAYVRIDVTEETLKQRKGFNQDNWPQDADTGFGSQRQVERPATDSSVPR